MAVDMNERRITKDHTVAANKERAQPTGTQALPRPLNSREHDAARQPVDEGSNRIIGFWMWWCPVWASRTRRRLVFIMAPGVLWVSIHHHAESVRQRDKDGRASLR